MKNKMKLVSTACFCLFVYGINAQEALVTSAQEASGTGGHLSSSFGQVHYQTNSGSSGTMTQGVQQAFEISVTSGIKETGIELNCSVFPNPTVNFLNLKITANNNDKLSYQLFDQNGRIVDSNSVNSENTMIDMTTLPTSTYFLIVNQNNLEIKTFKIIKKL